MNTINLYVGNSSSGEKVYENILVASLGDGQYKILASPGLVLGIAKDDIIKFFPKNREFKLLSRGKNICVQVYLSSTTKKDVNSLADRIKNELNGTMDGRTDKQVVFSIPVESGFLKIEKVLSQFVQNNSDCEWYYGNVYDEKDGSTPLNWWLDR